MNQDKFEFSIGDEVTYKPYEKELKAIVIGVGFEHLRHIRDEHDNRVFYQLRGDGVVSKTSGRSIVESEYFDPATRVCFRKFPDGEVVALFPDLPDGNYITSYQHIGQHIDACAELIDELDPATYEEYEPLLHELVSHVGYNVILM